MLLRLVGSCCAKFETGQLLATCKRTQHAPNIVGPTMLGVVASVCTELKILPQLIFFSKLVLKSFTPKNADVVSNMDGH